MFWHARQIIAEYDALYPCNRCLFYKGNIDKRAGVYRKTRDRKIIKTGAAYIVQRRRSGVNIFDVGFG